MFVGKIINPIKSLKTDNAEVKGKTTVSLSVNNWLITFF